MTIFLHIGTHKTGTTAIQRYLARNRDNLKNLGIWYPRESELLQGGDDKHSHLINIARSLDPYSKSRTYNQEQLKEIAGALIKKSKAFEHTIISAEAFWRIGFGRLDPSGDPEPIWRRKADNIASIRQLLGADSDIRIIGVLRERSSYLQSSYSEFILATYYHQSINKFLDTMLHVADYNRQLKCWSEHFPVTAYSYESLCSHKDLPERFMTELIGSNPAFPEPENQKKRFNTSAPIPCVLIKRYLNGIRGLQREKLLKIYKKSNRLFAQTASNAALAPLHAVNSWLTAKEIVKLRRRYLAEDGELRVQFCPAFVSGPTGKQALQEPGIKPLTREAQYLALGWMLSQKQPTAAWFNPAPTP